MKPQPLNLEELAELEHKQWVYWSKSIIKQCLVPQNAPSECQEKLKEKRERWKKFWIPYSKLEENVKEYDRKWAKKVLQHLKSACEFWLRYKDNPELLGREHFEYYDMIVSEAEKMGVLDFENEKLKLYNEWLFKLAFKDVME